MINWGPPNWSLIKKHDRYIKQWKGDIMEKVLKEFERSQMVKTAVYVVGFDFQKNQYVESYHPVEMEIMDSPRRKFELFVFLQNIDKYIPFEPLALIMSSYMIIRSASKDIEIPSAIISFQTRMKTKRYVYKIVPDPSHAYDDDDEKMKMEEDPAASTAYLGPEVAMFDAIFPLQISEN